MEQIGNSDGFSAIPIVRFAAIGGTKSIREDEILRPWDVMSHIA
jgi:hypothetical protein